MRFRRRRSRDPPYPSVPGTGGATLSTEVIVRFIDDHRGVQRIDLIRRVIPITPSTYFAVEELELISIFVRSGRSETRRRGRRANG